MRAAIGLNFVLGEERHRKETREEVAILVREAPAFSEKERELSLKNYLFTELFYLKFYCFTLIVFFYICSQLKTMSKYEPVLSNYHHTFAEEKHSC